MGLDYGRSNALQPASRNHPNFTALFILLVTENVDKGKVILKGRRFVDSTLVIDEGAIDRDVKMIYSWVGDISNSFEITS
jgi:hypothetical protein